jgi:hypothetical protein
MDTVSSHVMDTVSSRVMDTVSSHVMDTVSSHVMDTISRSLLSASVFHGRSSHGRTNTNLPSARSCSAACREALPCCRTCMTWRNAWQAERVLYSTTRAQLVGMPCLAALPQTNERARFASPTCCVTQLVSHVLCIKLLLLSQMMQLSHYMCAWRVQTRDGSYGVFVQNAALYLTRILLYVTNRAVLYDRTICRFLPIYGQFRQCLPQKRPSSELPML